MSESTLIQQVASRATRNDKVSWNRKMNNMIELLAKIKPIEDQILDLHVSKIPLMDQLSNLRKEMVDSCIHPAEQLIEKDGVVECKFCNRKIALTGEIDGDNNS